MEHVLEILFTASLAATSVTLWTVRIAVTARGNKALGSILAAVEAMLFIVAFSKLIGGLSAPHLIVAYGSGVAAGTLAGLTLDARLNPQLARVDVFDSTGTAIQAIVGAGFPFTRSDGFGSEGRVEVASVVTSESRVQELIDTISGPDHDAFWTVAAIRRAHEVRVPGGHRQPGAMRSHRRLPRSKATAGYVTESTRAA